MPEPLFDRESLASSGFFETALAAAFRDTPVGIVDVGARWGVSDLFRPIAPVASVTAFEADREEAARIAEKEISGDWAAFGVVEGALGARAEDVDFHILARANNSSVYPVRAAVAERYAIQGFDHVRTERVPVRSLDSVIAEMGEAGQAVGEIIKLDIQGGEYDVLEGARDTLGARVGGLICEVQFMPCYEGIRQFAEIDLLLRDLGLVLYGLLDTQERATKQLDKRQTLGRERLIQADAVYLYDPLDLPLPAERIDIRRCRVSVVFAMLLGYFDFALELLDRVPGVDCGNRSIRAAIEKLAAGIWSDAREDMGGLVSAASLEDSEAVLRLGRMVDRRRDLHTYHDVPGDAS